jgi:hypothetical protein
VLIALAHHADKNGVCWPSQQTIADELEMGVSTVRMHVTALQRKGLIDHARRHRRNGSRTSNEYMLMMGQPPESGGSLAPDFSGTQPPESSGSTDSPPDLSGDRAKTSSENQDNRQISADLPPESGGPTTFEQSGEGKTDNVAAAAEHRVAGAHTCEGETPATEAAADSGKAEALDEMKLDANAYAAELDAGPLRRTFKYDVKPIVTGDDYTVWRDTTGTVVPWSERPRLLRLAISILAKNLRQDIRRSVQLAILQQFDPFNLVSSNTPKPGSENAAVLARGKSSRDEDQPSTAPRIGHAQKLDGTDDESIERERDARVDAWIADNEAEAAQLLRDAVAEVQRTPIAKLGTIAERATRSKFRNAVLAKLGDTRQVA